MFSTGIRSRVRKQFRGNRNLIRGLKEAPRHSRPSKVQNTRPKSDAGRIGFCNTSQFDPGVAPRGQIRRLRVSKMGFFESVIRIKLSLPVAL
jgi:hypothetical protein